MLKRIFATAAMTVLVSAGISVTSQASAMTRPEWNLKHRDKACSKVFRNGHPWKRCPRVFHPFPGGGCFTIPEDNWWEICGRRFSTPRSS